MSILLGIFTFVLILTSIFLILLVLAQKAKSDGGMGAAMGGGMAEATFGAETGNVLSKLTINAAIVFFLLSFGLYLGRIYEGKRASASGGVLPTIAAPLVPAASKTPPRVLVPATSVPTPTPATKP
ncbi:MAG TPA: preprotein translocase subunit SecG [Opitutaceae bacterium]|nr:preprotein translocase subunit SecG [Opitutaceae bacterium]